MEPAAVLVGALEIQVGQRRARVCGVAPKRRGSGGGGVRPGARRGAGDRLESVAPPPPPVRVVAT